MLKLYGFGRVNKMARGHTRDLRVLWVLEELQLPFELVGLDHPRGDLAAEAFHRVSPFAQIPVIDDGGVLLSESGAILVYLARKTGRLIPADLAGEAQVVRWCFAAVNTLELPVMNLGMVDMVPSVQKGAGGYRDFLVQWAQRHLHSLNQWLDGREFVATPEFTVADILMAHVLDGVKGYPELLLPHAHVRAYLERCQSRPAWRKVFASYCERVVAA